MHRFKHIVTASLTVATATTAAAGTADFDAVAGPGHAAIDLAVTVQDSNRLGYDYEFVIENNTQVDDAVVTGFYFESGWGNLLSTSPFERNLDLGGPPSFSEGGILPGITGWTGTLVSYEAMAQAGTGGGGILGGLGNLIQNLLSGLGLGHSATIAFVAQPQTTLADLEAALGSQGYGIGVQVQGLSDHNPDDATWALAASINAQVDLGGLLPDCPPDKHDGSASVPTPSAALLGLAMVGLAMTRRRRND